MNIFRQLLIVPGLISLLGAASAQNMTIQLTPTRLLAPFRHVQPAFHARIADKWTLGGDLKILIPNSWEVNDGRFTYGPSGSGRIDRFSLGGVSVTPEARYWFSGNAFWRGFYGSLWLRYGEYQVRAQGVWIEANESSTLTGKLTMRSIGGGGSMGFAWRFNNRICLDYNLGIGVVPLAITGELSSIGKLPFSTQDYIFGGALLALPTVAEAVVTGNELVDFFLIIPLYLASVNGFSQSGIFNIRIRSNFSIGYCF